MHQCIVQPLIVSDHNIRRHLWVQFKNPCELTHQIPKTKARLRLREQNKTLCSHWMDVSCDRNLNTESVWQPGWRVCGESWQAVIQLREIYIKADTQHELAAVMTKMMDACVCERHHWRLWEPCTQSSRLTLSVVVTLQIPWQASCPRFWS